MSQEPKPSRNEHSGEMTAVVACSKEGLGGCGLMTIQGAIQGRKGGEDSDEKQSRRPASRSGLRLWAGVSLGESHVWGRGRREGRAERLRG